MTLGQIGTDRGPDFDRLAAYRQRFGEKDFVAAGGIRNKQDLTHLQQTGIHHALIASALHSGAITASDIEALN
jgi:phosphoribosylformimino-5-aminoimidazole carboxamide ribotide isomerase